MSHISVQEMNVREKGLVSLYSILLTAIVSLTILSIQQFIPSQYFYPLFVNNPENSSASEESFQK